MAKKTGQKQDKTQQDTAPTAVGAERYMPRLRRFYLEEIVPKMQKEFDLENPTAVPKLERIVLNMGVGEAIQNIKVLDDALDELAVIAGQRPSITRARRSIAAFKVREGMPIGCRVTLRGTRMWDFLDRLVAVALPRVRDFRGLPSRSFDGRGNYTFGIQDHVVFPEVDYTKVEGTKGLNVTIVTTAQNDEQGSFLLRELGVPLAQRG